MIKIISFSLLMIVGFLAWEFQQLSIAPESFDSGKWLSLSDLDRLIDPGCYRGGMARDLLDNKILIGKSQAEVRGLLGKPSTEGSLFWSYAVGQCSGFGWYHTQMEIKFSVENRVNQVTISRD